MNRRGIDEIDQMRRVGALQAAKPHQFALGPVKAAKLKLKDREWPRAAASHKHIDEIEAEQDRDDAGASHMA